MISSDLRIFEAQVIDLGECIRLELAPILGDTVRMGCPEEK